MLLFWFDSFVPFFYVRFCTALSLISQHSNKKAETGGGRRFNVSSPLRLEIPTCDLHSLQLAGIHKHWPASFCRANANRPNKRTPRKAQITDQQQRGPSGKSFWCTGGTCYVSPSALDDVLPQTKREKSKTNRTDLCTQSIIHPHHRDVLNWQHISLFSPRRGVNGQSSASIVNTQGGPRFLLYVELIQFNVWIVCLVFQKVIPN